MEKRIITTDVTEEDFSLEGNLRPQTLDDYIGQEKTKSTLKVYIEAAKQRHDALDHVLFYGPPGLGKTTLSGIIANEMGVHMKVTSGPAIEKPGEMAAILTDLLRFQTDQVSRLASLVRTLLEMSDLQSIPREDHIELAPLADEIVADLTPLAQRRSITLFQECEDVSIKGSDTLIYRLLFNLVENGIKYNTPGGSVHITIRQKKSSAVLRVADTGCGIPEEYRTSVFQPFFRVDKSRSREMGGVGLGLALVREIALLHGGTVTAEPADGHGTVFTVTLPIQA